MFTQSRRGKNRNKNSKQKITGNFNRKKCSCMAQKHPLINNCLHCGRIVCEIEGAGPCFFCGNIVVGKNSKETYEEDLEFFGKLDEDPILQESYFKALENKDKLLGYEQSMSGTKNIVDDEVDWYEIKDDVWQDKTVRQEAMKRVLKQEAEGGDVKTDYVVDFDAKSGKFVDRKITISNIEKKKEEMKEFLKKIEQFEKEKSCVMGVIEQQSFADEKVSQLVANAKKQYKQFEKKHKKTSAVEKVGDLSKLKVPERGWNKKIQHDDEYLAFEKLLQENMKKKQNLMKSEIGKDDELYNLNKNYVPRCMTLWQPWASLIVYGIKRFEGRMWNSGYRGPLWIHSGAKEPNAEEIKEVEDFYREMFEKERKKNPKKYKNSPGPVFPKRYPTSSLVGIVDVQDVWTKNEYGQRLPKYLKRESSNDFVFVLRNPKHLPIPIKCKGSKEIYEIPKDRAQIAIQGIKYVRTDFMDFFAKKYIREKPVNKEYYEIQYVNIAQFEKKKEIVVDKNLQKVWDNGALIDFSEPKEEEEEIEEKEKEPSPEKVINVQVSKKKKKKRKRKKSGKAKPQNQNTSWNEPPAQKEETRETVSDPFTHVSFNENILEDTDYPTGKLIQLSNDSLSQMAIMILKRLKKSLKNGFESLKTFDMSFFESQNFTSFVKFLLRTQYSMRNDGFFDDLETLFKNLRVDVVKYVNFRKWKRIERKYQMIYIIGDGVKITDDSRKAFVSVKDNNVFVIDQDHCQEGFLLKELKVNERAPSSQLNTSGGYSSFMMCFYFM